MDRTAPIPALMGGGLAIGVAARRAGAPAELLITTLPDGDFLVENVGGGLLEVTVTEPESLAGTYSLDPADMEAGPVFLTAPTAAGTQSVGQTLTATSALIAYRPEDGVPASTWSWERAGSEVDTDASYVYTAGDNLVGVSLTQTATNGAGARSATGTAIAADLAEVSGTTGSPTITSDETFDYYTFLADGSITFDVGGTLDIELVGGGGGGGGGQGGRGGGGGAGARVVETGHSVTAAAVAAAVREGAAAVAAPGRAWSRRATASRRRPTRSPSAPAERPAPVARHRRPTAATVSPWA